jgi:hypothetical protein
VLRQDKALPATTSNKALSMDDLPVWMRRAFRRNDWGILLAFVFAALIAWSFIVQTEIPRVNDLERYIFRAADTAAAISEGRLYPRWSSHVLDGYGAPFPHYTPPLPSYLPALIDVLFINDPVVAMRLLCFVAFITAGVSMYLLVARHLDAGAGLLASLLYLYNPVIGIIIPHVRGDIPALLVIALVPAFLLAVDHGLTAGRAFDTVIIGLLSAAIILTAGFLPFAVACVLTLAVVSRHVQLPLQTRIRVILAISSGAALSAFYWLPALLEFDAVRWVSPGTSPPRPSVLELIQPFPMLDTNALRPTPPLSLGVPLIGALLLACPFWFTRTKTRSTRIFAAFGFVLLMLWGAAFNFRFDLLASAILCFSFAASAVLNWRTRLPELAQRLYLPVLCIIVLISSIGVWLTPHWQPSLHQFDALAQIEFEQSGFGIAVQPPHQMLAVTLPENAPINPLVLSTYRAGNINRIELIRSTSALQFGTLQTTSHRTQFQVRSTADVQFRLLTAYFPGWQVTAATNSAVLQPEPSTGLMTIDVPSGTNDITIELGSTEPRLAGWLIAAGGVLLIGALAYFSRRTTPILLDDHAPLSLEESRLIAIIAVTFAILLALFAFPFSPARIGTLPGRDLAGSTTLRIGSDAGLEAIAFQLNGHTLNRGSTLDLTTYWRTLRQLDFIYHARVSLLSRATGTPVTTGNLHVLGDYPTPRWLSDFYVQDRSWLVIPDDLPPGEYDLALEVFPCRVVEACASQDRLSFFDATGVSLGRYLILTTQVTILAE